MLAQQGKDWQDGESAFINTPEVAKIIDTQKRSFRNIFGAGYQP